MLKHKTLCAAFLCVLVTSAAFCQTDPNPPANVYNNYNYTSFSLPKGTGTLDVMNNHDVVAGSYLPTTPSTTPWGYLRYPGGKVELFTVPNAVSLNVHAINDRGEVLGTYTTNGNNIQGFLRHPDGKITTFADAGATGVTIATGLNNEGNVFGVLSENGHSSPFLRYPDGQYLTFSIPGAPADPNIFTQNINDRGVALGVFFCANSVGGVCAFYGKPGGKITTFSYPPNGLGTFQINNRDQIGGFVLLNPTGADFFLRDPDGKMVFFGLNKIKNINSIEDDMLSINDEGEAISAYSILYEPSPQFPGGAFFTYDFVRSPEGKISSYDPPSKPGTLIGTVINNRGVIAGRLNTFDGGFFLLTPKHPHCEW